MGISKSAADKPHRFYIISVTVLTFIIPVAGYVADHMATGAPLNFELFGKWFIFSAAGLRLLLAGMKQVKDPAFTAKKNFHIDNVDSFPIIRELGFANLCFGIVAIISFVRPE